MTNTQQTVNYTVDRSIVDDSWVIVSKIDGGIVDGADSREEAEDLCAQMNADDR